MCREELYVGARVLVDEDVYGKESLYFEVVGIDDDWCTYRWCDETKCHGICPDALREIMDGNYIILDCGVL